MTWVFLLIFAIVLNIGVESKSVTVTIADGILKGYQYTSTSGKTNYNLFKGIPYAKPPLKDLRFKAPQPPVPWQGVRDATKHGPMCMQRDYDTDMVVGSEDCLYLNVYTPDMNPSQPLAVIFVIPGYLFRTGSSDNDYYGPGFLMDYNVVLVTINYRLGPFGFLCADTEDVPGNAALMDQILALKWVQKNIKTFGGDPSKVTVYGHGGGAASASLHYVSPLASGLFARLIIVSGVFYCDWSSPFESKRYAFGLAGRLGLSTSDPNKMLKFLRIQPPQNLLQNASILMSENVTSFIKKNLFTPVREKYFRQGQYMTDNPVDLLNNGTVNNVDLMVGHTAQDALFNAYRNWDLILNTYPYFYRLYLPTRIDNFRSPADTLKYAYEIKQYYFGNDTVNPDTAKQFVNMYSFLTVKYPIHEWVMSLPAESPNKRYFFNYRLYTNRNYFSKLTSSLGIAEATSRDEAPYLFDGRKFTPKLKIAPKLWKYVDMMCTLWTNFAKYGNPTPNNKYGVKWPVIGKNRKFMVIDNDGLNLMKIPKRDPGTLSQQELWRDVHARANVTFRDSWEYSVDQSSLLSTLSSAGDLESCR